MNFLRSTPGEEPVIVEAMFRAAPERVFRAWTDPEEVKAWFGLRDNELLRAEIDLRVGGVWRFHLQTETAASAFFEGRYFMIDPARRLEFSWTHVTISKEGARHQTMDSRVTVTFKPVGAATQVRLRHEAIHKDAARINVGRGWEAAFAKLDAIFSVDAGSGFIQPPA